MRKWVNLPSQEALILSGTCRFTPPALPMVDILGLPGRVTAQKDVQR